MRQHLPTLLCLLTLLAGTSAHAAEAIEFSYTDIQGNKQESRDYRGKWVIVNFWATYCAPCIRELPELSSFHNAHKGHDAVVLGINNEPLPGEMLQNFVKNIGVSYPIVQLPPEQETEFGSVPILPTTFILSPDGELVARQQGAVRAADLDAYLARKKAQRAAPSDALATGGTNRDAGTGTPTLPR